jgi:hypothetical protein
VAVELSLSHAFMATLSAAKKPRQGGMSILELAGSYSF